MSAEELDHRRDTLASATKRVAHDLLGTAGDYARRAVETIEPLTHGAFDAEASALLDAAQAILDMVAR